MLDIDILVNDAVAAFNNNETVEVTEIVEVGVAVPVPSQGEAAGEGGAPPEGEKKEEVVASEAPPPAEQPPPAETTEGVCYSLLG